MLQKIDFILANPSGNLTILVLTQVPRTQYQRIAQQLLALKEYHAEQVGFIRSAFANPAQNFPEMEMCGLEFCGNASRAFALYLAQRAAGSASHNTDNAHAVHTASHAAQSQLQQITVQVSGCQTPLTALVNLADGDVSMEMPIPIACREYSAKDLSLNRSGTLVSMEGISHLILEDIPPMQDTFEHLKHLIYRENPELPAFGVMFCDTEHDNMTPVVYVKNVDSTCFEGSCASGTVAAAFARSRKRSDGRHEFTMQQPEGTLQAIVTKENDLIRSISLKGRITLSKVQTVSLP